MEKLNNKIATLELLNQTQPSFLTALAFVLVPYLMKAAAIFLVFRRAMFHVAHPSLSFFAASSLISLSMVMLLVLLYLIAYSNMFSLFRRRLDLYAIALHVYIGYKTTQRRVEGLDEEYSSAAWEAANRF